MNDGHVFDQISLGRDCTCGWKAKAESRTTVDEARSAWQQHINEQFAVPPAMQRASSEAQFNVIGDELRKMNEQLKVGGVIAGQRYGALLDHAEAQAKANEQLAAQLTALRADADKGGEQIVQKLEELGERLGTLADAVEPLFAIEIGTNRIIGYWKSRAEHCEATNKTKQTGRPKKRHSKRVRKGHK